MIKRTERFVFLVNQTELKLIADLASTLQRTRGDAVRFVVTEAARQLSEAPPARSLAGNQPTKPPPMAD